jgi:hypothetical protein
MLICVFCFRFRLCAELTSPRNNQFRHRRNHSLLVRNNQRPIVGGLLLFFTRSPPANPSSLGGLPACVQFILSMLVIRNGAAADSSFPCRFTTTLAGTSLNKSAGRLEIFFSGMVTKTTSSACAASFTLTGFAPVSAASLVRVCGPREFATKTGCPAVVKRRVVRYRYCLPQ